MRIGKAVASIPPNQGRPRDYGKYGQIYKSLDRLPEGQWLPVTFDSTKEAYNFRVALETHRTRSLEGKQRSSVVYVRVRPDGKKPRGK